MVNQRVSKAVEASQIAEPSEIFTKSPEYYKELSFSEKIRCFDTVSDKILVDYDDAVEKGGDSAAKVVPFAAKIAALRDIRLAHSLYTLPSSDALDIIGFLFDYMSERQEKYKSGIFTDDDVIEYRYACVGICYIQTLMDEMDSRKREAKKASETDDGKKPIRNNRIQRRNRIDDTYKIRGGGISVGAFSEEFE